MSDADHPAEVMEAKEKMFSSIHDQGSDIKPIEKHIRLIRYYEIATDLGKKGSMHENRWKDSGNPEDLIKAYIYMLRGINYVLVEIPKHPQHNSAEWATEKKIFRLQAASTMERLETLKPMVQKHCLDTALAAFKPAPKPPPPPPEEPYPEPAGPEEPYPEPAGPERTRFEAGSSALYIGSGEVVLVLQAHYDDVEGEYYSIQMPDGREKQTTADRLSMDTNGQQYQMLLTESTGPLNDLPSDDPTPSTVPSDDPKGSILFTTDTNDDPDPFDGIAYPTIPTDPSSSAPPASAPPLASEFSTISLSTPSAPPANLTALPTAPPPSDRGSFQYPNAVYPQLSRPTPLPTTPFMPIAPSTRATNPPPPPPPEPPRQPPPPSGPAPSGMDDDLSKAIALSLQDQQEVTNKRDMLARNLERRGLREQPVPGDNNCQFHALAKQLAQNGLPGWTALTLRREIVSWLAKDTRNGGLLMDLDGIGQKTTLREAAGVDSWSGYCRTMSIHGTTWGDELTLIAASAIFRAEIVIISSVKCDACHTITPPEAWGIPIERRLYLGHYHEYHYTSVEPRGSPGMA